MVGSVNVRDPALFINSANAVSLFFTQFYQPFCILHRISMNIIIKKRMNGVAMFFPILKTNPGINAGEVRGFMLIHNAKNKTNLGGKPIEQTSAKSRKTYYTEEQNCMNRKYYLRIELLNRGIKYAVPNHILYIFHFFFSISCIIQIIIKPFIKSIFRWFTIFQYHIHHCNHEERR